jgi:hypothetical protein
MMLELAEASLDQVARLVGIEVVGDWRLARRVVGNVSETAARGQAFERRRCLGGVAAAKIAARIARQKVLNRQPTITRQFSAFAHPEPPDHRI